MAKTEVIQAISSQGRVHKKSVMCFDEIDVNTIKAGGKDNQDGLFELYDADGNLIVVLDNLGTLINSGNYRILEDDMEISGMSFDNKVIDHSFEFLTPNGDIDATYFDFPFDPADSANTNWDMTGNPRLLWILSAESGVPTKYGGKCLVCNSGNYLSQNIIPVKAATTYFLSGYHAKGDRSTTSSIPKLEVQCYNVGTLTATYSETFTPNSTNYDWKRGGFEFTTGASDDNIVIIPYSTDGNYAYWDGIQLIENNIACIYNPETSVFNLDLSSGGGGTLTDGDKGDITVSASGATWLINNGKVTLAKMANMATGSLIYRKTAGSGAPEVNTLATLKTDLGLTGTNSGDQDLSGLVPKTTTVNSKALSSNITLTTADVADSADKRYVTDAQKTVISNTSNTNTGDETTATIKSKLGITTLSGNNTGDQDISGKEDKSNKVTSISGASTDTQYPSAKLVYDQLATKQASGSYEVTTNKKTSLVDNSDTYYPSQKAVKTAVDAKQDSLGYTAENSSNKENTTIDTSTTKYPTVNLLKTGLDTKEPVITKKTGFNLDLSTTATDIKMNGTQSLGVATTLPRADHVHPSDTSKITANADIVGATKTKITYDTKGLVTSGADATTADIADSTNKRYCTDTEKTSIGTIGNKANDTAVVHNTGDETVAGVKTFSSFPVTPSSAPTLDYQVANKKYVNDAITAAGGYTDENAQDAVGGILTDTATIDLNYNDVANQISADVKDGSITETKLNTTTNASLDKADSAVQSETDDDFSVLIGRDPALLLKAGNYVKPVTTAEYVSVDDFVTSVETVLKKGWYPSTATWTYSSADSPTFIASVNADMTGLIGVGDRIKLTQTTVKYFIVTAVGAYSGGATLITMYGGTDYTLANATITLPFYSHVKNPLGFPANPDKWSVTFTDTTLRSQASPSINTWYNLANVALVVPIGAWYLSYNVMLQSGGSGDTSGNRTVRSTLSTASNSDSNPEFANGYAVTSAYVRSQAVKEIMKVVATKTTWYLNTLTEVSTTAIYNLNGTSTLTIKARCAYL